MDVGNNIKQDVSVSFTKTCSGIKISLDECGNEDDIQISLAPNIQAYLAQSSQRIKCCGLSLPIPFERAASSSWWDPRFDSEILEGQYTLSAFPQIRLRFRYSLLYIFATSILWCIYLMIKAVAIEGRDDSFTVALMFGCFSVFTLFIFMFTRTNLYTTFYIPVSILTSLLMFGLSLLSVRTSAVITPIGDFSLCLEILMLMYTVIPLPLYLCVIFGIFYSCLFEYFMNPIFSMPVRAICHICVHLIGIHILVMTHVRMRGTFMKVGQSLLVGRQLEMEKQLKEKMIHSVMPPKVADWLMSEGSATSREIGVKKNNKGDINCIFRPFNMHVMEEVSILFADIVGFTKMSSSKTAEELVAILNNLFGRFDNLCMESGCEKISTLGDCYYCVSGCPEPRPDHAQCCIKMGLGMIDTIAKFTDEDVNMRVGVHTGTVLCGIVGTKRVKFDVWSNDVTLANKMESTGKPGMVHLSSKTKDYLDDKFIFEEGEMYKGMNTYFIRRCIVEDSSKNRLCVPSELPNHATEPRRASFSLASAISMHISQTAELDKVLTTSQSLSLRAPSPGSDHCNTYTFSPPLGLTEVDISAPVSQLQSPLQRVLKFSSQWKATSLPSCLDIESDRTDINTNPCHDAISVEEPGDTAEELLVTTRNTYNAVQTVIGRDDQSSMCFSMSSRKDSGIRSTSRKSSFQQSFRRSNGPSSHDLFTHRVSGYFTSSQSSSMNNVDTVRGNRVLTTPLNDHYGICFQKLRKQSDLQLIRCVQDNSQSQRSYFVKPPLHSISLFFCQQDMECEYRLKTHRSCDDEATTLATARFNTHLDITVAILVFLLMSVASLWLFPLSSVLLPLFLLLCTVQCIALFLCLRSVFWPKFNSGLDRFSDWFSWHVIGGVLVSLPVIMILLSINEALRSVNSIYYFTSLFFIGIIHFCNFTQLNNWMKSSLATIAGLIYIFLVVNCLKEVVDYNVGSTTSNTANTEMTYAMPVLSVIDLTSPLLITNHSQPLDVRIPLSSVLPQPTHSSVNSTVYDYLQTSNLSVGTSQQECDVPSFFLYEVFLDVTLILLLVWFLNREFEISCRLSFHGNVVAARDRARVQMMRDQAELLLHNIIPKHVVEHIKTTAKYSDNVHNAGIIFASIINFSDMYDESYLGGKECLRVLNELVSDFDELLDKPEFSSVEKIKTIGSTYMAASGLNSRLCEGNHEHLHTLMNFALKLQAVIDAFNHDLLEFNLILRIGYCHGDVTAGVMGTTKLYYDIWGDAVNIASRMDSTGVPGRVQLPANCLPQLQDRFIFEQRGQVYVKGKENMNTYLLVGKKVVVD